MRIFGYSLGRLVPGFVAAVCLAIVGGVLVFLFVILGGLNLAATWADPKPVYWTLHHTFKNSVWWRATEDVPDDLDDEGRIRLGAQHYANACAKCHGGPGLGQNPQALAMRPRPQHLAEVVDQFTDGELHYILDSGVRMSAMPGWPTWGREDEIWNVVAFIRQLPDMTSEQYVSWLEDRTLAATPSVPYGERGPLIDNGIDDAPFQERFPAEEYAYQSPATEWRDFAIQGDVIQRCAACHGSEGTGEATLGRAPNLTVLDGEYITASLRDFASGERKSGIMQIVASNLSAQQREEIGQYYASLADQPPPVIGGRNMEVGERIATEGKIVAAVPACVTCHNNATVTSDGVAGINPPDLAGQSPIYIKQQLEFFAAGVREGGARWKPMGYIASQLDDAEMEALAGWFSAQEPGAEIERQDLLANADLAAGEEVVIRVCDECHTRLGIGSQAGDVPNLTLQNPQYLHQQLWKFREDIRPNSRMSQTTKQISEEDMANAAAYFGAAEPITVTREVDPDLVAAGEDIAQNGIPDEDVPACLSCHGAQPTSEIAIIPRLLGQNRAYLQKRLDQFAGLTGEDIYDLSPMPRIATRMTGEQREAVAAWFSAQLPLAKN